MPNHDCARPVFIGDDEDAGHEALQNRYFRIPPRGRAPNPRQWEFEDDF